MECFPNMAIGATFSSDREIIDVYGSWVLLEDGEIFYVKVVHFSAQIVVNSIPGGFLRLCGVVNSICLRLEIQWRECAFSVRTENYALREQMQQLMFSFDLLSLPELRFSCLQIQRPCHFFAMISARTFMATQAFHFKIQKNVAKVAAALAFILDVICVKEVFWSKLRYVMWWRTGRVRTRVGTCYLNYEAICLLGVRLL